MRSRPSSTTMLVGVCVLGCLSLASASALPPVRDDQSAYLHFPHPETRHDGAFSSNASTPFFANLVLPDEDWRQNPVPALNRHPRAKRDLPNGIQHQPGKKHKRDLVTVFEPPFPPGSYIDINNLTTIALVAEAAVARMQTWYEGGVFEWTGWWQTPILGMAYAGLDNAFGNSANELLITDLLVKNGATNWIIDKYIDDQTWWVLFAQRAYQAYPNSTWLDQCAYVLANNTLYETNTCGGGVLWLTYQPWTKNTITNGIHFSAMARQYRLTGNSTYYTDSLKTLNWWLDWGFDAETGQVYDTIASNASSYEWDTWYGDCAVSGLQTWTYNSGAFIFGLTDLYYATNDTKVLNLARTLAYAGIRDFSDSTTGVLTESCEHDPAPDSDSQPGCQQDELAFKAIFMMAIAELYIARPDQNIYNFVNTQLLSNVFNNIDNTWLFGEWWGGPWNETTAGPKTQINALGMLAAAAQVNAAHLASIGHDRTVAVSTQIQVPVNTTTDTASSAGNTNHASSGSTSWAERGVPRVSAVGVALVAAVVGGLAAGVAVLE